jgi:hypothetical protein
LATNPAMGERSDGRLYSRITRRCVVLLKHIRAGRTFDLVEIAREIPGEDYPEFRIRRGNQPVQIKSDRIRDYLSYLVDLGFIQSSGSQYTLRNFTKPSADGQWAQILADSGREHLSSMLGISPNNLPSHLESIRQRLHEEHRVPTIAAVLGETGIEGIRREEVFRWSLNLYTDGDATPLEIRQYSHIATKA